MITIYSHNAYLLQSDAIIWYAILMPCYEFLCNAMGFVCYAIRNWNERLIVMVNYVILHVCYVTLKRDHKIIIRPVTQLKLELNLWFA